MPPSAGSHVLPSSTPPRPQEQYDVPAVVRQPHWKQKHALAPVGQLAVAQHRVGPENCSAPHEAPFDGDASVEQLQRLSEAGESVHAIPSPRFPPASGPEASGPDAEVAASAPSREDASTAPPSKPLGLGGSAASGVPSGSPPEVDDGPASTAPIGNPVEASSAVPVAPGSAPPPHAAIAGDSVIRTTEARRWGMGSACRFEVEALLNSSPGRTPPGCKAFPPFGACAPGALRAAGAPACESSS
jgi:hypothetical protein